MQFRKMILMILASFAVTTAGSQLGFCAEAVKIGTINFQKIFENSTTGKSVKAEITSEGQRMEAELKQKGEEIKSLEQMLERDAGVMSKEARDEKKWQLDRKVEDAKALKRKYDRQIQEMQMRLVNEVRRDVVKIIQDFGKKEGYQLIIEDISVVYAPNTLDITDQIVQMYNQQGGGKAGTKK